MNEYEQWFEALPRAFSDTGLSGVIRRENQDFQVTEVLGFAPDGQGEHWWMFVETSGMNTAHAALKLADANGLSPRDIGYSGLKDRHAITRQWFSLPAARLAESEPVFPDAPDWTLLEQVRHTRKLKRGTHQANQFGITICDVAGDIAVLESRADEISRLGLPNYFGAQRFGRQFANIDRAEAWAKSGGRLNRKQRGFVFSAARSAIFNTILGDRIRRNVWRSCLPGDRLNLNGSGSHFAAEQLSEDLRRRCERGDIHPTATLWGQEGSRLTMDAQEIECDLVDSVWPTLADALSRQKLKSDLRPLRALPEGLEFDRSKKTLTLSFSLRRGVYATALLREFGRFPDAS